MGEDCCMGARGRGLGGGRPEGAKVSSSLLVDWGWGLMGPRLCGRWERSGVGASMEELARAPCWGWWAKEDVWVVCSQATT